MLRAILDPETFATAPMLRRDFTKIEGLKLGAMQTKTSNFRTSIYLGLPTRTAQTRAVKRRRI